MELARALTSRKRHGLDLSHRGPARAASMRTRGGSIKRSAISPPVELLSTTNVLAYNAPNIYGLSDDSDSSLAFSGSSRATSPETSSSDDSSPMTPNHLTSYFPSSGDSTGTRGSKDSIGSDSPTVPQRALSHTKKSHQALARMRSASKTIQPPISIHASLSSPAGTDIFSSKAEADHPFGAELAQVNEVAEGFGARDILVVDEEEQFLMNRGLCKFGAEDYVDEIQGLFGGSFNNPFSPFGSAWI